MERLLSRLERRFGGFAIPNLTSFIVGGMAISFVLAKFRPPFLELLTLDIDEVKRGQVWRLVTYLFLPTTDSALWMLFALSFGWYVGSTLENHWGSFRFNLFYLLGCVGTTVAALLTHRAQTNVWLNMSLMLAFGTLFPDEQFYLFVIPIRAKWYAIVDGAFLAYSMATGDTSERAAIVAALAGYLVFCGPALVALLQGRRLATRQAARRAAAPPPEPAVSGLRVCALCGASEENGADIRVCSCAKCGGSPRNLCLQHARNH